MDAFTLTGLFLIGLTTGLVAMILPYRHGTMGVVINLVVTQDSRRRPRPC